MLSMPVNFLVSPASFPHPACCHRLLSPCSVLPLNLRAINGSAAICATAALPCDLWGAPAKHLRRLHQRWTAGAVAETPARQMPARQTPARHPPAEGKMAGAVAETTVRPPPGALMPPLPMARAASSSSTGQRSRQPLLAGRMNGDGTAPPPSPPARRAGGAVGMLPRRPAPARRRVTWTATRGGGSSPAMASAMAPAMAPAMVAGAGRPTMPRSGSPWRWSRRLLSRRRLLPLDPRQWKRTSGRR